MDFLSICMLCKTTSDKTALLVNYQPKKCPMAFLSWIFLQKYYNKLQVTVFNYHLDNF